MAIRERDPRIQALYDAKKNIYSYSKLTTINDCEYEAYQTYIQKSKQNQNIYGIAGSKIHDALENIINNISEEAILLPLLNEELKDYEMLGLAFPKDRNGGNAIGENWVKNMTHFCTNFKKPIGDFKTEELLLLKIDEDHYLQGYCDVIKIVDKEKKIAEIIDWKTSSQFTKDDLVSHGRQLVIYQMALEQLGWTVTSTCWYMLKYCEVSFMGKKRVNSKNNELITLVCERRNLVKDLTKHIEYKLKDLGYDDLRISMVISRATKDNDLEEVNRLLGNEFTVRDYIRYYDVTDELKDECLNFIKTTIQTWESKNGKESDYKNRCFYKELKNGKMSEDTFFCAALCGHSKHCARYQKFLNTKQSIGSLMDEYELFL